MLKSNRKIETFSWDDNSFHSTEDACKLVDAALEHPTVSQLYLERSLDEGTGIVPYTPVERLFRGVGNGKLIDINLNGNGIKTDGGRCISDFLAANPPLKSLYLGGNQLSDDDALHIALALQSNTNLRRLLLENNLLTERGKHVAYHQAIFGLHLSSLTVFDAIMNANLNTVSEANHTCRILGLSCGRLPSGAGDNIMNGDNFSGSFNRGKKLFFVLAARHYRKGYNITQFESEFSGAGMRLVPHVLACVSTYSETTKLDVCLSVFFELVRDWKTPEMYQFQHCKV